LQRQSPFLLSWRHCQASPVAIPKGDRGHIVPPFFVYLCRPKAPSNDGFDVFFFCFVLLLQSAQVEPKPPEWLVRLLSVLGNWFSYSRNGRGLTASQRRHVMYFPAYVFIRKRPNQVLER